MAQPSTLQIRTSQPFFHPLKESLLSSPLCLFSSIVSRSSCHVLARIHHKIPTMTPRATTSANGKSFLSYLHTLKNRIIFPSDGTRTSVDTLYTPWREAGDKSGVFPDDRPGIMRIWLSVFFWLTIAVITVDIILVCLCTVKQRK